MVKDFGIRKRFPYSDKHHDYYFGFDLSYTEARKDLVERGQPKLWNFSVYVLGCEVLFAYKNGNMRFPRLTKGMGLKYLSNIHRMIAWNRNDYESEKHYDMMDEVKKKGNMYLENECECKHCI